MLPYHIEDYTDIFSRLTGVSFVAHSLSKHLQPTLLLVKVPSKCRPSVSQILRKHHPMVPLRCHLQLLAPPRYLYPTVLLTKILVSRLNVLSRCGNLGPLRFRHWKPTRRSWSVKLPMTMVGQSALPSTTQTGVGQRVVILRQSSAISVPNRSKRSPRRPKVLPRSAVMVDPRHPGPPWAVPTIDVGNFSICLTLMTPMLVRPKQLSLTLI